MYISYTRTRKATSSIFRADRSSEAPLNLNDASSSKIQIIHTADRVQLRNLEIHRRIQRRMFLEFIEIVIGS